MLKNNLTKATKLLASYSYWNYEFNRKIRHKLRGVSKSFLTNSDSVDYAFVLKTAKKAKVLHYIYFMAMFLLGLSIVNEFINIYQYHHYLDSLTIEDISSGNYDTEIKTPAESILIIFTSVFFAWIASFIYDYLRYKRAFTVENNIDDIDISSFRLPSAEQNICVFSGKKPFIGSGTISKNFSFVLSIENTKKFATDNSIIDFTEDEIYDTIENAISATNQVRQKLYINGSHLNDNIDLLSAIDTGKLEQDVWQKYCKYNSDTIRRYICVSSNSQSEEVQSNFFIRFIKSHNSLYVELTTTSLLPIATEYRIIEQLPQKISFIRFVIMLQSSIFTAIANLAKSIFYGFGFIFNLPERVIEKNRINKQIKENPLFDYGEISTLREDVADILLQTFFNAMDNEHLSKQAEKSFFGCLIKFLDSKNIDTSELTQQEATIINHGLIMSGGEVKANNIAIGKMSKIFGSKKS